MEVKIEVDLSKALVRLSDAGIPESVRTNLRRLIPPLANNMVAAINNRLNTQLKSRNTIEVTEVMRENPSRITATIAIESPSAGGLLPTFLELGTKPHEILPVNAQMLHFVLGGVIEVFARRVDHPGTKPYLFMQDTLAEFMGDIQDTLDQAREGL
jgi:hypothetical protein